MMTHGGKGSNQAVAAAQHGGGGRLRNLYRWSYSFGDVSHETVSRRRGMDASASVTRSEDGACPQVSASVLVNREW